MTDKDFRRTKRRIRGVCEKWEGPLGLRWWKLNHEYIDSDFKVNGSLAPDTVASCHVRWEYKEATISWNMSRCRGLSDEDLEYAAVHEFMHIFLNENREGGDDWLKHEERVATQLAWAFLWVKAGIK